MHQYLSHLLTSNYNQLGLIVMFAICKIMNCFNLSFQQLAERIASPPPFPSVKSPITVSPPTSFPTMKSPVREMVSERGNRSESPPSRGMSIIFIFDHQWVFPIFPCLFLVKKKTTYNFFIAFFCRIISETSFSSHTAWCSEHLLGTHAQRYDDHQLPYRPTPSL